MEQLGASPLLAGSSRSPQFIIVEPARSIKCSSNKNEMFLIPPKPALINSISKSASKTLTASQMKCLRDEVQNFDSKFEHDSTGNLFKMPKFSMFSTGQKLPSPKRPPLGSTFAVEETKTTERKRFQPKREDEFLAEFGQMANPNVRRTLFSKKQTPKTSRFTARRTSIRKSTSVTGHNINVNKNKKTPVKLPNKSKIVKPVFAKPVIRHKMKPESNEDIRTIINANTECLKTIQKRVNILENDIKLSTNAQNVQIHSSNTDCKKVKIVVEELTEEKSVYCIVKENNDLLNILLNRLNSLENAIKENKCNHICSHNRAVDTGNCIISPKITDNIVNKLDEMQLNLVTENKILTKFEQLNTQDKTVCIAPEVIVQETIKQKFTFEQLELNLEDMSLTSINIEDSPDNRSINMDLIDLEITPCKSKAATTPPMNNVPDYIQRYNEMRTELPLLCTPKLHSNQPLMTPSNKNSTKKLLSRKVQEQLFLLNRKF